GTELGFPTANLAYPPGAELPENGVYVAQAAVDGRTYVAILNQGSHPTVPEGRATIETHLLGYEGGELYGKNLTLTYLAYLRPERRFENLAALKAQLAADEADALRWVRLHRSESAGASAP
ncbi:MAG: riboflavin kinase, partial [Eubacteriales bacterium]|nr:riboflavin kinase [Eubacteriales bacterium]